MQTPEPTTQHQWLKQLIGEWNYTGSGAMGDGQPSFGFSGTQTVRGIGELWILGEQYGTMPDGTPSLSILTVGYDPKQSSFVGSWIGSMMNFMWHYTGHLEANVLALDTTGPDMSPGNEGKMADYQERIEVVDADTWTFSSQAKMPDGSWFKFMNMKLTRKK